MVERWERDMTLKGGGAKMAPCQLRRVGERGRSVFSDYNKRKGNEW
jgi:hypothetical protein